MALYYSSKKLNLNSLYLLVFITILTFALFSINIFLRKVINYNSVNLGVINPTRKYFLFDNETQIDFGFLLQSDYYDVTVMKVPKSTGIASYEIIYCDSKNSLSSGTMFKKDDFEKKEKLVIIGNKVTVSKDEKYVNIYNNNYRIIGVFDSKENMDYTLYYTNGSIHDIKTEKSIFAIECSNSHKTDKIFQNVLKHFEEQNIKITEYHIQQANLLDSINGKKHLMIFALLFYMLYLIAIHYMTSIWINSYSREISILNLLGKPCIEITMCLKFISIYSVSFLLNAIVNFIFIRATLSNIFLVVLCNIIFELTILCTKINKIKNTSINRVWEDFNV